MQAIIIALFQLFIHFKILSGNYLFITITNRLLNVIEMSTCQIILEILLRNQSIVTIILDYYFNL